MSVIDLRPHRLDELIGNEKLVQCLKISLDCARRQDRPIEHILMQGISGAGKSTIARIIGNEQNGNFYELNAASVKKNSDLLNYIVRLKYKDVLFIDEIHTLRRKHEEFLYPVMEDFKYSTNVDLVDYLKYGLSPDEEKTIQNFGSGMIDVQPFTLIGATTDVGNLSAPLKNRFSLEHFVQLYSLEDIAKIVERSANLLNIKLDSEATNEIAKRSKRVPRIANARVKWVRDYAMSQNKVYLSKQDIIDAMDMIEIDERGYDKNDLLYLAAVEDMQPVGLQSIAARTQMSQETIRKYIEPPLLNDGIIRITTGGRVLSTFSEQWRTDLNNLNL